MPSITLYASENHRFEAESFATFSTALAGLAREILKAKENNIHISYVTAEISFGTPIYFEARLRQEIFRTASLMEEFTHQVDLLIKERTGVSARIRCFSFDASNIYGKN
ncbi:hypothetical protein CKF42_15925 [Pantoea sp. ARC270]|uniref:hypothetical protein n=1 Tax=Pantoea sp. ARC270 TaxID=2027923 RepID=UPI000DA9B763|nr:hypothetical protein [Pantoea sp. ARC270]PZL85680.1 hypothetical protein CKF42_15925 [Pantoea sp. ARC270]